jgi:hypothetical protein
MIKELYFAQRTEPQLRELLNDSLNQITAIIADLPINVKIITEIDENLNQISDIELEREVRYRDFLNKHNQVLQYLPRLKEL